MEPIHILYVANISASTKLYSQLLSTPPNQASEHFVIFAEKSGMKMALWSKKVVQPQPKIPGGTELAFSVDNREAVFALHQKWAELGLDIIQDPTDMYFGFTFCAKDADGHRLRVVSVNADA